MSTWTDGDEEIEQHPSFGIIQLSRTTGGGKRRLFGSAIRDHAHTLRLRIYENAQRRHSLGVDRYWAPGGKPLVEVELSAAQFAEFITTMNVACGTPCTVLYANGKRVDSPPEHDIEVDRVKAGFQERMRKAVQGLGELAGNVRRILADAKMTNKQRDELQAAIVGPIEHMSTEIGINAPFWLEQFEEATERITKTAKAEVDALMTTLVQRAGLKKLAEGGEPLALNAAEDGVVDVDVHEGGTR